MAAGVENGFRQCWLPEINRQHWLCLIEYAGLQFNYDNRLF